MRTAWLATLSLALLAGCTDFNAQPPGPQNRIGIIGIDVSAPVVSAGSVTLAVATTLDNLEAPSGSLNLTVKAYDGGSSMLVRTGRSTVGALAKDKSKEVTISLELPRSVSYRIEVLVEQDGRQVQMGTVQVSNLAALEPTLYDTGLRVASIDVEVKDTKDGHVSLRCPVYLTNEGATASRPLRLQLKAREVSTGILADEQWQDVGPIGRDQTRIQTVLVSVPDKFNYALQAFLWDGDVIVEHGQGQVQLLPTYTKPADQQLVVSNPDISLFRNAALDRDAASGGGGAGQSAYYGGERPVSSTTQTPGLGLPILAVALAGCALVLRRRSA
jgi:hypothetical protein